VPLARLPSEIWPFITVYHRGFITISLEARVTASRATADFPLIYT
jgi:hypothetical protein